MNKPKTEPLNSKVKKEGSSVQAVERALNILKVIGEFSTPVLVSEIAKITGVNRTTVWRLVGSLEKEGFVEKDPITKGYHLGYALYKLISQNNPYGPLIRLARKTMEELKKESGETVLLSVPKNNGILTIDQIDPDHAIRLIDYSNTISPLACTSNGKIFLSLLSEKEINVLLEQSLKKYSKNTITDPDEFRKELEKIRIEKVGICLGELDENENAISAPIFDKKGNLVAFITIGGPSFRLREEELLSMRDQILDAAKEIERQLN